MRLVSAGAGRLLLAAGFAALLMGSTCGSPAGIAGDVNGDGRVDVLDLSLVTSCNGRSAAAEPRCANADANGDGTIDVGDASFVAARLGATNRPPLADVGPIPEITLRHPVAVLDGSGSYDPDGQGLTFRWSLLSRPAQSQAALQFPYHPVSRLTPDVVGDYRIELVVNDGLVDGAPLRFTIKYEVPTAIEKDCDLATLFKISPAAGWKKLNNPACLDADGDAVIAAGKPCQYAYVDGATAKALGPSGLRHVRIRKGGRLVFLDDFTDTTATPPAPITLHVSSIFVDGGADAPPSGPFAGLPPGQLVIGTDACPIQRSTVTLALYDTQDSTAAPEITSSDDGAPNDDFAPCGEAATGGGCPNDFGRKVIAVGKAGELSFYGAHGVKPSAAHPPGPDSGTPPGVSWTTLAATAIGSADAPDGQGATSIELTDDVDWRVGDWIVIATTDFSSHHSEIVQITGQPAGRTYSFATPLVHTHFGGKADLSDNFGVDERAPVGLLTRNIRLTARMDDANPKPFIGGHLMVRRYFGGVAIQGVEFENFGQGGTMGRYPVHFHLARDTNLPVASGAWCTTPEGGPASLAILNSNSIHHTYLRCMTVHGTNDLSIENTVCARNIGHGFYLEDGLEYGNTFESNLVTGTMQAGFTPDEQMPAGAPTAFWAGDHLAAAIGYQGAKVPAVLGYTDAVSPSAFWIRSPDNTFRGNAVAGCQGRGKAFWYLPTLCASGLARKTFPQESVNYFPYFTHPGPFEGNRASACYVGLDTSTEDTINLAADGVTTTCSNAGGGEEPNLYENYFPKNLDQVKAGLRMEDLATGGDGACSPLVPGKAAQGQDCRTLAGRIAQPSLATFQGFTATRNRRRGIWVRPSWTHLDQVVLGTNLYGASLVSSGSADGSPPGVWGAMTRSLVVGTTNNVHQRFGDTSCPIYRPTDPKLPPQISYPACQNEGGFEAGVGYPDPKHQLFGFLFYDGPARLEDNTFKNFLVSPAFSAAEQAFVEQQIASKKYQGDAAMGWFQANQNTYPGTQYTLGNRFENVDFRHMIYTAYTGTWQNANFLDGDANTVIQDRDGTLTGYRVAGADGTGDGLLNEFPFVLNNLPFHSTPEAVAECLSAGAYDVDPVNGAGEPAAGLVSPHDFATLAVNFVNAHPEVGSASRIPAQPAASPGVPKSPSNFNWDDCTIDGVVGAWACLPQIQQNPFRPVPDGLPTPGVFYNKAPLNPQTQDRNGVTFMKDQDPHLGPANAAQPGFAEAFRTEVTYTPPVLDPGTGKLSSPGTPTYGLYAKGRVNYASFQSSNFEPKVQNRLSYTLHFPFYATPPNLSFGLVDVVTKNAAANRFSVRVGVCYQGLAGASAAFTVRKGAFPFGSPQSALPADLWNDCADRTGGCPVAADLSADFQAATSLADLAQKHGARAAGAADYYYFDSDSGMLYFYVEQDVPTGPRPGSGASAFSPTGTCNPDGTGGSAGVCQRAAGLYSCPAEGCAYYVVRAPQSYVPAAGQPAICPGAYTGDADTTAWTPYPTPTETLARVGTGELCPATTP